MGIVLIIAAFNAAVAMATTSTDSQLIETIQNKLLKQTKVSGTFTQNKFIKEMDVTLDSSGTFSLESKEGLHWRQLKPFVYTLKLGSEQIEVQSENAPPEVMSRDKNPMIFAFSQTFLSLFSGDLTLLKGKFNYQATGKIENWTIALTPVADIIKKAIRHIHVTGAQTVNSIKIEDAQGNSMTIHLTASAASQ